METESKLRTRAANLNAQEFHARDAWPTPRFVKKGLELERGAAQPCGEPRVIVGRKRRKKVVCEVPHGSGRTVDVAWQSCSKLFKYPEEVVALIKLCPVQNEANGTILKKFSFRDYFRGGVCQILTDERGISR